MISIEEAIQAVISNTKVFSEEINVPLENSVNSVLFRDILSPINMPPFRQSAMDGYALHLHEGETYSIIGEIKAGDNHRLDLKPGEAVRIFTGAPVPDSANAVIMQEKVLVKSEKIIVEKNPVKEQNIRPIGEQVEQGQVALTKGTKLTPAAIGYLSSLGITHVFVYKKPSIAIVATGNELVEAGKALPHARIYDSNSLMLKSALINLGYNSIHLHKIQDDYSHTYETLKSVIKENEVVLITGGISVGDYDFVGKALNDLDVEQVFYKVNQKPGKPLFFGKNEDTVLFALPGNPAAALTCFYLYVSSALQKMSGLENRLIRLTALSNNKFVKTGDRPQILKAFYNEDTVTILEGQSSAMLHTFALANAFALIPADMNEIKVGDKVQVILFPN